jgi:hypothetical protein
MTIKLADGELTNPAGHSVWYLEDGIPTCREIIDFSSDDFGVTYLALGGRIVDAALCYLHEETAVRKAKEQVEWDGQYLTKMKARIEAIESWLRECGKL